MRITFLMAWVILIVFSCSKSDIDPYKPRTGEIKLIFDANSNANTAFFYIEGEGIRINWGDGNSEESNITSFSLISHQYEKSDKEYIITIKYSYLKRFGNRSSNNISYKSGCPFKLMAFGEGVQIPVLYFESSLEGNVLEMSPTSEIQQIYLSLFDEEFDFTSLEDKAIDVLDLYVVNDKSIEINNMRIYSLSINLYKTIDFININSCRDMSFFSCSSNVISVENLTITDAPKLMQMTVSNIEIWKLYFYETNTLRNVIFHNVKVHELIRFADSIENINIQETRSMAIDGISSLDISNCYNLKKLTVEMKSLETINIGHLPCLEIIGLTNCYKLKEVDISNMPMLYYFMFQNVGYEYNDVLESINRSNTPNLSHFYVYSTNYKHSE